VLTEQQAVELLSQTRPSVEQRAAEMQQRGYPAYTTSVGWSGYPPEKVKQLCAAAQAEGFNAFKMKVGLGEEEDQKKANMMRELLGWDAVLMMDANSVWGVDEAIEQMAKLAKFRPYWIEEPTSPDDIVGHAAIAKAIKPCYVATGEQMSNRVMHKQFLQLDGYGILQTDVQRLGGLNEYLLVCLMAQRKGVRVCCHAGGVGLCNMAAHLAVIDFVSIGCSTEGRWTEYIDHLQEHFVHPLRVKDAKYLAPDVPGWGVEMTPETLAEWEYPNGTYWAAQPKGVLMENRPCDIPTAAQVRKACPTL